MRGQSSILLPFKRPTTPYRLSRSHPRRASRNMSNDAFIQEYLESTDAHPLFRLGRIWRDRVAFDVEIFDGAVHLDFIIALNRGRGDGHAALVWLCELADKHGCTIKGTIRPCGRGRPRLNTDQLRQWYKRHGFTIAKSGRHMIRQPLTLRD